MRPLKEAKTFEEQLKQLKEAHGMDVGDADAAIEILSTVNYYRLSAYGIGLKEKEDPEKYQTGVTLEHLYHLYLFDERLRSMLFLLLEKIEIELRTQIAYHLSLKYGPEGYMDPSNFQKTAKKDGQSIHSLTIKKFQEEIKNQSKLPCVIHHNTQYGGHFPLWVAVEVFTFGMLSSLYKISQSTDQDAIAAHYGLKGNHLKRWMPVLSDLRNRCAHHGRLYNMPLTHKPFLFSEHRAYRSNKLFAHLLVLKRMLRGKPSWNTFIIELGALFESYPEANLSFMGFPLNWQELLNCP